MCPAIIRAKAAGARCGHHGGGLVNTTCAKYATELKEYQTRSGGSSHTARKKAVNNVQEEFAYEQ